MEDKIPLLHGSTRLDSATGREPELLFKMGQAAGYVTRAMELIDWPCNEAEAATALLRKALDVLQSEHKKCYTKDK